MNELNIQLDPMLYSGVSLEANVYDLDGVLQDNVELTEHFTLAIYSGDLDLSGYDDGTYHVRFQTATTFYGDGILYVKDGAEVTLPTVPKNVMDYVIP